MGWPVMLPPHLSERLDWALRQYRDYTDHEAVRIGLSVVLSMMERGITLTDTETQLVREVLIDWFDQMDTGQHDEMLERAFYKLYGEWPIIPPYFVSQLGLPWP